MWSMITLTAEQEAVIATDVKPGQALKIIAYAGTGKTSTFVEYSHAHDHPMLYLAFNKSVEMEAKEKFGPNVRPKTIHALAYAVTGRPYHKIGSLRYYAVMKFLKTDVYPATLVCKTLENYLNSADEAISPQHAAPDVLKRFKNGYQSQLIDGARAVWEQVKRGNEPFPMTHNGYLKLYQLTKPNIPARTILLDEAQDTNPVTLDIVRRQMENGTRVLLCGDPYQQIYCQPKDTVVAVPGLSIPTTKQGALTGEVGIAIQRLKKGDKVISYGLSKGYARKTGCTITDVQTKRFTGLLVEIDVERGNSFKRSQYTPEHHCIVRIGNVFENKYIVYLMRKGISYRIGRTTGRYKSQHNMCALALRAAGEKAEAVWLLGVYDSLEKAALAEQYFAWSSGVPLANFVARPNHILKQDGLNRFWSIMGDLTSKAATLLSNVLQDIRFPLWDRTVKNLLVRRPFVTAACNLKVGMSVLCFDDLPKNGRRISKTAWRPITAIRRQFYDDTVFSITVADHHTYFGDGILTHNSWRGAIDAMDMIDAPRMYLTHSFRFGDEIAEVANRLLEDFLHCEIPVLGHPDIEDMVIESLPSDEPYTIICRTNVEIFRQALRCATAQIPMCMVGSDGFTAFLEAIMDVFYLYAGLYDQIKERQISFFKNFNELKLFAEARLDPELQARVNIVSEYKDAVPTCVDNIRANITAARLAKVFIVTAHKAKGLEWNNVMLTDDFADLFDSEHNLLPVSTGNPEEDKRRGYVDTIPRDEVNLLYVAATRAKRQLKLNHDLRVLLNQG